MGWVPLARPEVALSLYVGLGAGIGEVVWREHFSEAEEEGVDGVFPDIVILAVGYPGETDHLYDTAEVGRVAMWVIGMEVGDGGLIDKLHCRRHVGRVVLGD